MIAWDERSRVLMANLAQYHTLPNKLSSVYSMDCTLFNGVTKFRWTSSWCILWSLRAIALPDSTSWWKDSEWSPSFRSQTSLILMQSRLVSKFSQAESPVIAQWTLFSEFHLAARHTATASPDLFALELVNQTRFIFISSFSISISNKQASSSECLIELESFLNFTLFFGV